MSASSSSSAESPPDTDPSAADPPLRFAEDPVSVGTGGVTVRDGVVHSYTGDALVAAELASGSQLWWVDLSGAVHVLAGPTAVHGPAPTRCRDRLAGAGWTGTP